MVKRTKKKIIKIGNVKIGGGNPVAIQSMTTVKTEDVPNCVKQITVLEKAGCELIRVSVKDSADTKAIKKIKKRIKIPIIADIHFDYRLALLAIENKADKIRINPGNIAKYEDLKKLFKQVLDQDYSQEEYVQQFTVKVPANLEKIARIREIYSTKVSDTPKIVFDALEQQEKRLKNAADVHGDYISPEKFIVAKLT